MAIQISGTTVVNNSRQLQNIASLDSTTTSTIAAAAGGGTKIITEQMTFDTSGTFTAPYTGDYRFILMGGGGGGWSSNTGGSITLRGGGGGGVVIFDTSLSANASFSFTVGAGGDTPSGTDKNGVAGSATTATINGTSLSAGGGGAGVIGSTAQAGGTASGGGINFNGKTATSATGAVNGLSATDFLTPRTMQMGPSGGNILSSSETVYTAYDTRLYPSNYGTGGYSSSSGNGASFVDGQSGCFHYICYVEA